MHEFGGPMQVADILTIEPFRGATVLVGETGLRRTVTAVTVIDSPEGIHWVRGGELVITSGYPFRDDSRVQRWVTESLVERGAAALGLKLGRYLNEVPEPMAEVALAHNFPILGLPYAPAWIDFILPVTRHMLEQHNRDLDRSEHMRRSLLNHLLKGGSLDGLIATLNDLVKNPVTLVCPRRGDAELIHHPSSSSPTTERLTRTLDAARRATREAQRMGTSLAVRLPAGLEAPGCIAVPVQAGGPVEGWLLVWEAREPLRLWEVAIAEYTAGLCSLEARRRQALGEVYSHFHNEFLNGLLSGQFTSRTAAELWSDDVQWDSHEDYVVLVADVVRGPSAESQPGHPALKRLVNEIGHALSSQSPRSLAGFDREGRVVLLLPVTAQTPAMKSVRIADDLIELAKRQSLPLTIGTGNFHSGLLGIAQSYTEALQALTLCRRLQPGGGKVEFGKTGVYQLVIGDDSHEESLRNFVQEVLGPLLDCDRESRLGLLKTLSVFVETRAHIRQTARLLFVHPNTVRYRLDVIQRLASIDLHSSDGFLQVQMALKLLRLIRLPGADEPLLE